MVSISSLTRAARAGHGRRIFASKAGGAATIAMTVLLQLGCAGQANLAFANDPPAVQGPVTTRELVELSLISVLQVSPDQTSAIVRIDRQDVASASTRLTWKVVDLQSGTIKGAFDAGDVNWNINHYIAGETPHWSPDSNWIYFRKLVSQEVQVWRARSDGSQLSQITRDAADVVGLDIRDDGSLVYATAGATRRQILDAEAAEFANGIMMGPQIITGFPITKSFPVNGRMATYRHVGKPRAGNRGTLLGDLPFRVMRQRDDETGFARLEGPEATAFLDTYDLSPGSTGFSDAAYIRPAALENGDRVASIDANLADAPTSPTLSRSGQLVSWRRKGANHTRTSCLDPICLEADDIQILGWRPGHAELVFQTAERGVARLVLWNTDTGSLRTIWEKDGVLGSIESGVSGSCQLAGDQAICIAAAGDLPPRIISISLETGTSWTVLDPNPTLTPSRLGVASIIELFDGMGSTSIGTVILPRDRPATRLPLVITSYSCSGFLQGGSGRDVPEHVLAGLGYAVICTDHSSDGVRRAPDAVNSTSYGNRSSLGFFENAVDSLVKSGIADPDRVLLSGFSGSTTAASFVVTRSTAFTAAIVTTRGSSDALVCYLSSNYRSCETEAKRNGFEWPYDARDGYLRDSPAWNADKVRAPLLMQLPDVEYAGMMQLYGALVHYERAVEMYVYPGSYHYKHDPRQRQTVYDRNLDWIDFWLKGVDPVRIDAKQAAARWKAMRESQCALTKADPAHDHAMWYCSSSSSSPPAR